MQRLVPVKDAVVSGLRESFAGYSHMYTCIDNDGYTEVCVSAMRVVAAHEDDPDEAAGYLLADPLDEVVQKIAKNDVGIDENHTDGQGDPADYCIQVGHNSG